MCRKTAFGMYYTRDQDKVIQGGQEHSTRLAISYRSHLNWLGLLIWPRRGGLSIVSRLHSLSIVSRLQSQGPTLAAVVGSYSRLDSLIYQCHNQWLRECQSLCQSGRRPQAAGNRRGRGCPSSEHTRVVTPRDLVVDDQCIPWECTARQVPVFEEQQLPSHSHSRLTSLILHKLARTHTQAPCSASASPDCEFERP